MRIKKHGIGALVLLIFFSLFLGGVAFSAPETDKPKSQRFITIDFENVDIHLFVKYISELTGKNFVIDNTVKGNVTIISPTKISEEEAYRVFESVLTVHGYTTVEAGAVTKIIPLVKARSENIRTFQSEIAENPEDKIVTQLIPLKHTTPDEIQKVLAPLVSKTSVVIGHTRSGMLIITETLSNINRLLSIIDAIDVAYMGEEIEVIPLEHASSDKVSKILSSLFQQSRSKKKGAKPESPVKIVPYDRINALIVVAAPSDMERVKNLMTLLDTEMRRDRGNIHVFYLQHATAAEMAKVLNFLPGQQASKNKKGKAPSISKDVKIMADEETNSLIITASRSEYDVLEGVIKKLDIPRRMVYLEALILEVNTTKDFEVGVEWALGGKHSDGTGTVTSGFSDSGGYPLLGGMGESSPPASASGFTFGLIQQGIQIGGMTFPNIGAVLRAYKNDSDINIVSTPQILTTDNKEAEISVGETVPYLSSQNQNENNTNYNNYERADVSTKLKITPHINQANTLRLEITAEVKKVKSNIDLQLNTLDRMVTTTVLVKNNETVVIGGIIGQDTTESNTRIPLLGDLPLIGWLFRTDSDNTSQTNMFIFITPKIIKNPADIASITMDKGDVMSDVMPAAKKSLQKNVDPTHAIRLCELAADKLNEGKSKEAKEYFLEALEVDKKNPYALYHLGLIAQQQNQKAEAFRYFQDVLLTGTTMTMINPEDPTKPGSPLLQLARERIEQMRKMERAEKEPFETEESDEGEN